MPVGTGISVENGRMGAGNISGKWTYGSGEYQWKMDVWKREYQWEDTEWLESVGLGLIRKLVCVRRETTVFDVFREVLVFD